MYKILLFHLISWCGNFAETQNVSVEFRAKTPEFQAASLKSCGNCTCASTKLGELGEILMFCTVEIIIKKNENRNTAYHLHSTTALRTNKTQIDLENDKAFVASVAILSVLLCDRVCAYLVCVSEHRNNFCSTSSWGHKI